MAPVAGGGEVAQADALLLAHLDGRHGARDLARHERLACVSG